MNVDNLEEELWWELQSNLKLQKETAEKFGMLDSMEAPGFGWDDTCMRSQVNRYYYPLRFILLWYSRRFWGVCAYLVAFVIRGQKMML